MRLIHCVLMFNRCRRSKREESTKSCGVDHLVNMCRGSTSYICSYKLEASKVRCYYDFYFLRVRRRDFCLLTSCKCLLNDFETYGAKGVDTRRCANKDAGP